MAGTSKISANILGKLCSIFVKNVKQALIFNDNAVSISSNVEGVVLDIDDKYLYVSEGTKPEVKKIIPISSIGYIEIDPEDNDNTAIASLMGFDDGDDGSAH